MKPRSVRFWLLTVAALAGCAATLSLGLWQWSRAQQKIELEQAIEARARSQPLDGEAIAAQPDTAPLLHRPAVLRGSWLAARTVYLDNRQMHGQPGFYVVTPLQLQGAPRVILVQRGWVPRNFVQRDKLPPVDTPAGEVEVRGRIVPWPSKLYEFQGAGTGLIRQNLDLAAFREETRLPLLEVTLQQTGAASEGLSRDWPEVASSAGKNYGYAFQWWALCGLIAFLYVWFQFIAPRRRAHRA